MQSRDGMREMIFNFIDALVREELFLVNAIKLLAQFIQDLPSHIPELINAVMYVVQSVLDATFNSIDCIPPRCTTAPGCVAGAWISTLSVWCLVVWTRPVVRVSTRTPTVVLQREETESSASICACFSVVAIVTGTLLQITVGIVSVAADVV
jgi:hypothetical protein